MNNTDTFTAKIHNKEILELYIGLSLTDKNILNDFGAQQLLTVIDYDGYYPSNLCQYLWVSAANIIPQGHYQLAETLLLQALNYAKDTEDLGHIHANLAQVYADQRKLEECLYHCNKTMDTGLFTKWATDTIESLS